MKSIINLLSSTRLMAVLLVIFGVAIAIATFIENDFGTIAARDVVYNARWFEIILILGCINILAVIFTHKLYKKEKLTVFTFHISFVVIILGAGITRYFGREGSMHIREGQTTSEWMSTETNLSIQIESSNQVVNRNYPVLFSAIGRNKFKKSITANSRSVKVKVNEFIPAAQQTIQFNEQGEPLLQLVTASNMGRQEIILKLGQSLQLENAVLSFVETPDSILTDAQIQVYPKEGTVYFNTLVSSTRMSMADQSEEAMLPGIEHVFTPFMLHNFDGSPLVLKQYMPQGAVVAAPATEETENASSALLLTVSVDGVKKALSVFGAKDQVGQFAWTTINNVQVGVRYGSVTRNLPFQLKLNDFIIKRYPGSESPSWFESNVQLIDADKSINREERIYMNHILKHRGYRFYQSSYDMDELGTVLSVNRDGLGSGITYLGYLIMTIGMVLSLFARKTRFKKLSSGGESVKKAAKAVLVLLMLSGGLNIQAQELTALPEIPQEVAEEFGALLVQDNGGRIEPVNTLASEVLRKVARMEDYQGQSPEQVLLGMLIYRENWQHEPMIRVRHPEIMEILNIDDKYASFVDFFSSNQFGGYTLRPYVEEAYRKKPAYRTKFDNEIIRVDERLNVVYLVYTQTLFKMFPAPDDTSHTWHAPVNAAGAFAADDSNFVTQVINFLGEEVRKSMESGNWDTPKEIIGAIATFQNHYGAEVLPSDSHRKAEAFYNKANIFERITRLYYLIGFLLLLLQFIHIFIPKFSLKWVFRIAFGMVSVVFLLHTLALALRWYIAGHAPWSNGYEALTFIAWASILAGIIFSRKSEISLSVMCVLAALILQTAHLSWMDPQVTNLVPVLQSYWLVIHVAVITASYAFLGLGAFIAAVNLLLYFFQNKKNFELLDPHIKQLTNVIELSLIVGLYMLTIGTFLGGVWANESWGRYWAWDPKETWALVTIIVYAIILHLRLVPGLKGKVLFNILSLAGFGSVIMTYFGVNYYLSGLHSYAKGDPLPIPPVVYYSVASVIILSLLAAANQWKLHKEQS